MESTLKAKKPSNAANENQSSAADPLKSVWVGASAGTGKTKVLIDRVLRLMLPRAGMPPESATRPDKILCLTFTKTAAAEMSNRIYKKLGDWAVMADEKLKEELLSLMGEKPSEETQHAARRLFARVLDTPGGLKIMTIHSFCQSVLKRFPIEAGLPPHFELMDEQSAIEYLERCLHDIIAEAKQDPSSNLAAAFSRLVLHVNAEDMKDLMSKIMGKRSQLSRILCGHGDKEGDAKKTVAAVYKHLGLKPGDTEEDLLAASGNIGAEEEKALKEALRALLQGSVTDQKKAAAMQPWLEQKDRRGTLYYAYRGAFFTQKGEIVKSLATKKVQEISPDIVDVMYREAERLQAVHEKLRAVKLAGLNAALLAVASQMVGRYEQYKRSTDRLDFDDLIIKTCELLSEKDMVSWVLYKLDEGIDHILVDEAQDTSPYQWRVIEALSLEFFAGSGTRDTQRTLFVVGDEKQSIFSFQGAEPKKFFEMQSFFGEKVREVQDGWEVLLEHSFRSTRAVLDIVDATFADEAVRQGVVGHAGREVRHVAWREGQAGMVELWPLVRPNIRDEAAAWQMPVEIEPGDNAASRLARKIAQTVQGWLESGEMLPSKNRPVRAGDILVLVQSRGAIVELLMRALKEAGVEVAGIDRMTLTEEIAVMDLLALARFALLPRDDLVLATLLKSPLIGLDEDGLYALAHGRGNKSLWDCLRDDRPEIAGYLHEWVRKAGKATPYEFFAEALNTRCFADDVSGRRAFYGRLGTEIHDALDEFLNSSLHYEQSHTPSLQKFVEWFMRGETQIKREQEQHKFDQVRIMTVHASKGLQAPIVFLPDTAKKLHDHNRGRIRLIWPPENEQGEKGVPLWSPREEFDADIYARVRDDAREGQEQEYRRLLYVALTRAEDRLYVCGYQTKRKPPEDCWHSVVSRAFPKEAAPLPFVVDGLPMTDEEGETLFARRHAHAQEAPPEKQKQEAEKADNAAPQPLPEWINAEPEQEPEPSIPLAPSKPGEDEPAVKGPLAGDEDYRYRRGIIVHQILEILPQLPEDRWEKALFAYLSRPALGMEEEARKALAKEILAVLKHPEFAPIFGAGSRAEAPVTGIAGANKVLSGQMDRLLVTQDEVLVVDYKTNRPPPDKVENVHVAYLKQMAAYRAVMKSIYPGRPIKCALLWTDGPRLMPLPEKLLEKYAP